MTVPATPAYRLYAEGLPKPNVPADYNRYFLDPSALPSDRIVGMLACQRDPYLRTFTSKIAAARKAAATPVKAAKGAKADKAKAGKKDVGANGTASAPVAAGGQPEGELWDVEFSDTILFPEGKATWETSGLSADHACSCSGGGQPNDTGLIAVHVANGQNQEFRVENVQRQGLSAIHQVRVPSGTDATAALEVGLQVDMRVDWERRFDHVSRIAQDRQS